MVQTRLPSKSSEVYLPVVQGVQKAIDPHVKLGKQAIKPITVSTEAKTTVCRIPRIKQGRAGLRRKVKVVTPSQPSKPAQVVPHSEKQHKSKIREQLQATVGTESQTEFIPIIQSAHKQLLSPRTLTKQVSPYPNLHIRPPPRLPGLRGNQRTLSDLDIDTDINTDFEENSPYQEGIISVTYERPDKSYIIQPPELGDLLDTSKLIKKSFPKQTDIDKSLEIIQRKVLKGTHLPLTVKEIQAGYLASPYFKDLYLYLVQNKLPSKKSAMSKVDALVERFILLDLLLFKLVTTPDKEMKYAQTK